MFANKKSIALLCACLTLPFMAFASSVDDISCRDDSEWALVFLNQGSYHMNLGDLTSASGENGNLPQNTPDDNGVVIPTILYSYTSNGNTIKFSNAKLEGQVLYFYPKITNEDGSQTWNFDDGFYIENLSRTRTVAGKCDIVFNGPYPNGSGDSKSTMYLNFGTLYIIDD